MKTYVNEEEAPTRAHYLAASARLAYLCANTDGYEDVIVDSIVSAGPSDLLGDMTPEQLCGAEMFINWIIDSVQYERGARFEADRAKIVKRRSRK